MTSKNGEVQAPKPRLEEVPAEMVQIAPIDVHLNSCQFQVIDLPDGGKALVFQHQTGVIRFTASLPPAAVADLVRMLNSGIEIARAMPVMQ